MQAFSKTNRFMLIGALLVSAVFAQGLRAKIESKQGLSGQPVVECCCPNTVTISSIPTGGLLIDGSSDYPSNTTYCVQAPLSFAGTAGQTAITVAAGVHDIVIDFNGFDLSLVNGLEIGIALLGSVSTQPVTNVVIKNGTISSVISSSLYYPIGVYTLATNRVSIENMIFNTLLFGIEQDYDGYQNTDLYVDNAEFTNIQGNSIFLTTIDGFSVKNSSFQPIPAFQVGIAATNGVVNNTFIQKCSFVGNPGPIQMWSFGAPSTNLVVTDSEFLGTNFTSINFIGYSNVQVTHSSFLDVDSSVANLAFSSDYTTPGAISSGLLVDHCTFNQQSSAPFSFVPYPAVRNIQIGSDLAQFSGTLGFANDVIIRNSTLTQNINPAAGFGANIVAFGGSGYLIENNILDCNSPGYIVGFPTCEAAQGPTFAPNGIPEKSANIHLGTSLGIVNARNVTIRGNQIGGGCQTGIYSTTGALNTPNERIVVEDNNITATEYGILLENTITSKISNNHITGVQGSSCNPCGVGIQLSAALPWNETATSSCDALIGNTVTNNITGILIQPGAQGNLIRENKVFNNKKHQIVAKKKENVREDNITFKKPKCNPCGTQSVSTVDIAKRPEPTALPESLKNLITGVKPEKKSGTTVTRPIYKPVRVA